MIRYCFTVYATTIESLLCAKCFSRYFHVGKLWLRAWMLVLDLGLNLGSTFFSLFPFLKFNLLLLNTVIQVSCAQFQNTSSVHYFVYSPPQVSFHHHLCPHTLLHLSSSILPMAVTILLSMSMHFSLFVSVPPLPPPTPHPWLCSTSY